MKQPRKRGIRLLQRLVPYLVTAAIFLFIFRRIPLERLMSALGEADVGVFLALMIPNSVIYFCWDTLVLTCVIRSSASRERCRRC